MLIWEYVCRLWRPDAERDVDDELSFHLEMRIQELVEQGESREQARNMALRRFGEFDAARAECMRITKRRVRRMARRDYLAELRRDVHHALRGLRRAPGFTAVVVATLALGIGGTTAVFSVVQAVLLAPLPYQQPGQLVRLYQRYPQDPSSRSYVTGVHFKALRDQAASFEELAALLTYSETGLDLVEEVHAQRLRVLEVTSGYFRALRSRPIYGRGFNREEEGGYASGGGGMPLGGAPYVVLSNELWRTRFGGDPSVIGRTIHLSAEPYQVVGIAPPGFEDPIVGEADAWLPYDLEGNTGEQNYSLSVIGRLRNGITLEQARAELRVLSESMAERWPGVEKNTLVALPLKEDLVATSRGPLQLLLIAVGVVLLVACVNVANLVLVRATGRVHEFAIRAALGSGTLRIARQLFIESIVVAGLGGLLGFGLAVFGVNILQVLGRDAIPRVEEVGFDP